MVDAADESNSAIELRERMAEVELALEDLGWVRLGYEVQGQLSRSGLRKLIIITRQLYLKHPLINHAVDVKTHYVWGQGIQVVAKAAAVNAIVQKWWDLKENRAELTGHRARMLKERELELTGNIFLALFTDPVRGTVRTRSIDVSEIADIICNPQDRREPWYYHRNYQNMGPFDIDTGMYGAGDFIHEYYPDWRYYPPNPADRPAMINGIRVRWDAPVYHMKAGGLDNMLFGVPEIFPAIDWARAVQTDLENYATVRKALARFAFQLTLKSTPGSFAAAQAKLASTIGVLNSTGEGNPAPVAGSTFFQKKDVAELQPVKTAGVQPSPDEGRRLGLMVTAGVGLPETMLWGDTTVGNYATAKSLDRPTELAMTTRQQDWVDTFVDVINYALDACGIATKGPLKGKRVVDDYSGDSIVQIIDRTTGQPLDRRVDIAFPPILQHDAKDTVTAIASAATLNGYAKAGLIDDKTLARLLLVALGVDNVDEVLQQTHPDEPNPPQQEPAPETPPAPVPVPAPAPAAAPPPPKEAGS